MTTPPSNSSGGYEQIGDINWPPFHDPSQCPACEGEGRVLMNAGIQSTGPTHIAFCPRCGGTGERE